MSSNSPIVRSSQDPHWLSDASERLAGMLISFLSDKSSAHAPEIASEKALLFLTRAGSPAYGISQEEKTEIAQELLRLAKPLYFQCDPNTLRIFAKNALRVALKKAPFRTSKSRSNYQVNPEHQLINLVRQEMKDSTTPELAATKAAARFLRDHGKKKDYSAKIPLDANDPLSQILALPSGQRTLPKNDIRLLLLKAANAVDENSKQAPLMSLLRQAAPFAPLTLRKALGDELYGHCRPVGYVDQQHSLVLIDVKSSSAAQELLYRRVEIIAKLKAIPGLEHIRDIRFRVVGKF